LFNHSREILGNSKTVGTDETNVSQDLAGKKADIERRKQQSPLKGLTEKQVVRKLAEIEAKTIEDFKEVGFIEINGIAIDPNIHSCILDNIPQKIWEQLKRNGIVYILHTEHNSNYRDSTGLLSVSGIALGVFELSKNGLRMAQATGNINGEVENLIHTLLHEIGHKI